MKSLLAKLTPKDFVVFGGATIAIAIGVAITLNRPNTASANCSTYGQDVPVILANDEFKPSVISAHQCDRIVLINQDTQPYRIEIGEYTNHVAYPGYYADTIPAGSGLSFVAHKAGGYKLHDHLRGKATAQLQISARD